VLSRLLSVSTYLSESMAVIDVEEVLSKLTLEEKAALTSGTRAPLTERLQ
jgi:hypothetical protein